MAHNESVEDCKTIAGQSSESLNSSIEHNMQVTTFTEDLKDMTLHFQIIQLPRQRNEVTVASILGGAADNTGLSISRRLVIKTGLNIVLACNIPKNCPMIEADAERLLLQKLKSLGYIKPKSGSVAS